MKLFIATETKVFFTPDQRLYTSNSFKKVLERYHRAFGAICLCTRIQKCDAADLPPSYEDATAFAKETLPITSLKNAFLGKHKRAMRQAIRQCDLVVARVPSIVAYQAASIARKERLPYLAEVVGCTWDSYWNYGFSSKWLAGPSYLWMRRTVAGADYATYVTERFLQKRYPCPRDSIACSNVIVNAGDETVLADRIEKIRRRDPQKLVLFTAAAIDVPYKGQEYVIRALPELAAKGYRAQYRLAGGGDAARLRAIARQCGVEEQVVFLGALSREDVMREMTQADIYIQPSLQEGLPRSVIEAMSRACPALGARTAGIPELLEEDHVFRRADPRDIVRAVNGICRAGLESAARRNFEKAREYDNAVLEQRRDAYYQRVIREQEKDG
ncbi:MAG: glycosyltransferase family 4 protein [Acutalibacteraceae bacterium]|jgi:glycosyltransferase involved in cell wall biosynthesis